MNHLRNTRLRLALLAPAAAAILAGQGATNAPKVTTPKAAFGFNVGDDYRLVNYSQLESYWKRLVAESDRIKLVEIGLTAEGRHQWMAIVSSSANLKNLAHYQEVSRKLAHAEGLSEDQARALAHEGKAVVWIDGGLHATENAGSQQLIEMVYQMLSRTDPETMRLLNHDIMLFVPANPDGLELVANWYMRHPDEKQRTLNQLPRLYQKYAGPGRQGRRRARVTDGAGSEFQGRAPRDLQVSVQWIVLRECPVDGAEVVNLQVPGF